MSSKTYTGRNVEAAVQKAADAMGVAPDALQYTVMAGQGGGFALIKVATGSVAGAAPMVEKLSGSGGSSGAPAERSERAPREDRPERSADDRGDRGGDRGNDRGNDRGGRGGDRGGRGGRGRRDNRGGDDRGPRRGPREEDVAVPVPTDGPTEVIMHVAEGVQLSEIGEDAHEVLRDVLTGMGFGMTVEVTEDEASIRFDMNSGVYHECLVAKEMELLDALQHLVDKVVNFDAEDRKKVVIDSGGAKRQVDEDLGRSAVELADRAVEEGKTFKMGPLDPRSRRLIHMALREHAGVTTRSEGEGVFRRVCIVPNDLESDGDGE